MSKRSKRILFYATLILFVVLSYFAVLYAQGYKYSFKDAKFIKTGSIFLKVNASAKVYFNETYVGATSFLGDSYTISKLLPGNYHVELSNEGTSKWSKNIDVSEGFVSDFSHILILSTASVSMGQLRGEIEKIFATPLPSPSPKISPTPLIKKKPKLPTPTPTPTFGDDEPVVLFNGKLLRDNHGEVLELADNVLGFVLSPNRDKVLWWNKYELWVVWLKDMSYQPYKKMNDTERIAKFSRPISRAAWFRGDDHVIAEFDNLKANVSYKIFETDTRGGINEIDL